MLYPFRWSNQPGARTAAAAGGCVLLDHGAFQRSGGLAPIRGKIIDDCNLAAQMKRQGPIWLGLTERVESLRPYDGVGAIRKMVARTAYAQLGYQVVALGGMLAKDELSSTAAKKVLDEWSNGSMNRRRSREKLMFADSFFETAGCWGVTRGANAKGLLIEVLLSQAHEHGGALNRRQFGAALPRTGSVGINPLGVDKLFLAFDAEARGRVKVEDLHALRAQSRAGGAKWYRPLFFL
jgi:hypothetical protein